MAPSNEGTDHDTEFFVEPELRSRRIQLARQGTLRAAWEDATRDTTGWRWHGRADIWCLCGDASRRWGRPANMTSRLGDRVVDSRKASG
jgi:hypothetical protein